MKITIEPEEGDDFETKVYERVFEFGLVGRCVPKGLFEQAFSHLHIADKFVLLGRIAELQERLRHGSSN